jgi:hypothetical protein
MAVYIARGQAGGDDGVPTGPETASFWDVSTEHWAYPYIEYVAGAGVVEGYPEGDYRPDLPVDRAQMAVYVARSIATPVGEEGLSAYVPPAEPTFADVPNTGYGPRWDEPHWAYTHVEYCAAAEVVQGYGDGHYHPDDVVTRDQMATYIARAFGLGL